MFCSTVISLIKDELAMAELCAASLINPGPDDPSLLYLHHKHVSQAVWQGDGDRVLKARTCDDTEHNFPPRVLHQLLAQAGFFGVACLGFVKVDRELISALVERWRPETHTFHMPVGEVTITLQDVTALIGLKAEGKPVVGDTNLDWYEECERLLGRRPEETDINGRRLRLKWLKDNFLQVDENVGPEELLIYARAYILLLLGGKLFGDSSSQYVHIMFLPLLENFDDTYNYSWGSAVLAFLYRELCRCGNPKKKDIGGCVQLICLWAWERFKPIAPIIRKTYPERQWVVKLQEELPSLPPIGSNWSNYHSMTEHSMNVYRRVFDLLKEDEFIWRPYLVNSPEMNAGQHLWLANVPLICFWIIEWHCPDRVMRQFGFDQPIPAAPVDIDWEHTQELKGKMEIGWESEQARYIRVWENSQARVCVAPFLYVPLTLQTSEYLKWYWKVTRRWISLENAVTVYTVLNQVFVVYSCVKLCFGSKELLNEGVVCCELQAMGVEKYNRNK